MVTGSSGHLLVLSRGLSGSRVEGRVERTSQSARHGAVMKAVDVGPGLRLPGRGGHSKASLTHGQCPRNPSSAPIREEDTCPKSTLSTVWTLDLGLQSQSPAHSDAQPQLGKVGQTSHRTHPGSVASCHSTGAEENKKPHHIKHPWHWRQRSTKSYLRLMSTCNDFSWINSTLQLSQAIRLLQY